MKHFRIRRCPITLLALVCVTVVCNGARSQDNTCNGSSVVVQRGDTLSLLADRCNVSEGSILAANPTVDGSMDLEAGQTLRLMRPSGTGQESQGIAATLSDFANDAEDALGRIANRVGASVQDLLDKNPDLRARLDRLGRKIGVKDGAVKATMAVTPDTAPPGATVKVSGLGWPKDSAITISGGPPGSASEALQTARTSSNGTFDVNIQLPSWAATSAQFVFTAKAEDGVRARSQRLQVSK